MAKAKVVYTKRERGCNSKKRYLSNSIILLDCSNIGKLKLKTAMSTSKTYNSARWTDLKSDYALKKLALNTRGLRNNVRYEKRAGRCNWRRKTLTNLTRNTNEVWKRVQNEINKYKSHENNWQALRSYRSKEIISKPAKTFIIRNALFCRKFKNLRYRMASAQWQYTLLFLSSLVFFFPHEDLSSLFE